MASASNETRVPRLLQAVFLASNRGNDVHVAPPKLVAFKTYIRGWVRRGLNSKPVNTKVTPENAADKCTSNTKVTPKNVADKYTSNTKKSCSTSGQAIGDDKPREKSNRKSTKTKSNKKLTKTKSKKDVGSLKVKEPKKLSPQDHLDKILISRGYITKRYNTLHTAYYNKPTALQKASYDVHLIDLAKQQQIECLKNIFETGISPNPCNQFGESLLHMVCRRGEDKVLRMLKSIGCCFQVCDDYGRTPLHDAFWAAEPALKTVDLILEEDISLLLMADCRGFLPLSYVRKDHWEVWIDFFESRKDVYWPKVIHDTTNALQDEESKGSNKKSIATALVLQNPDSRPLPDPENALPLDLATMLASGTIRPEEAAYLYTRRLAMAKGEDDDTTEDDSDSSYDSDDSDSDSDESSRSYSKELEELLGAILVKPVSDS